MSLKIGITGANGFIGRYLVDYFASRGDTVKAFQRGELAQQMSGVKSYRFSMPDENKPDDFADLDVILHTAVVEYGSAQPDADEINYEGTKTILNAARRFGAHIIYFSTFSAHPGALSHYGRSKLQIEKLFDQDSETVLKLGLVLGEGGLFGDIVKIIQNSRFIPLPGGGRQPIQTIWIGDLLAIISSVVDNKIYGKYDVAEFDSHEMRDLYQLVASNLQVKRSFFSVPLGLIETIVGGLELLRIPFPIKRENVLGLRALRAFDTRESMARLGIDAPIPLEESIKRLVHTSGARQLL